MQLFFYAFKDQYTLYNYKLQILHILVCIWTNSCPRTSELTKKIVLSATNSQSCLNSMKFSQKNG